MKIDGSAQSVAGFSAMSEPLRVPAQPVPASAPSRDSIALSALSAQAEGAPVDAVPGMISANAGDALAAHSRLDPERALRLLGLLDA